MQYRTSRELVWIVWISHQLSLLFTVPIHYPSRQMSWKRSSFFPPFPSRLQLWDHLCRLESKVSWRLFRFAHLLHYQNGHYDTLSAVVSQTTELLVAHGITAHLWGYRFWIFEHAWSFQDHVLHLSQLFQTFARDRWTQFQSGYLVVQTLRTITGRASTEFICWAYKWESLKPRWQLRQQLLNHECSVLMCPLRFEIFRKINSHNEHWQMGKTNSSGWKWCPILVWLLAVLIEKMQ